MVDLNKSDTLSLLESTNRDSNFSYQAEREQNERLRSQVRTLDSENAELRRIMPRLIDAQGSDTTEEFAKLERELHKYKTECQVWEEEHHKLLKKHNDFEQNAMDEIGHRDKQIVSLKKLGLELEDENTKLREKLQDAEAKIKQMEQSAGVEQSLEELHIRDQIRNSIAKIPGLSTEQIAAQFNESFGDVNPDDADQIAAHIFMILEKLETNNRANEELRSAIFNFLSQHGFTADEKKFAMFNGFLKEMLQKRQNEIRTANDRLGTKFGGSIGGKEFEACIRQLNQDSISFSNTLPGGTAADIALANQTINTTVFDPDNVPENITLESIGAIQLAEQTSNIAESCVKMFDRLRGTAEFFLKLLETISEGGESELGTELMKKIESLRLDLDKSMEDARSILVAAKDAENNARSFLETTLKRISDANTTMYSTIFNQSKLVVDAATSAMVPAIDAPTSSKLPQNKELAESICAELNKIYDTMSDVCISSKKIKAGKGLKGTYKKGTNTTGILKNKNEVQIKKPKEETNKNKPK
ncbi:hypothetical protein Mgra_00004514 [Meloidogyne graminicola]|uniref:Uncharacterized protein n=1 Tax=Meloidogyne graminicola TaxID=189291 RepID=A0A8S9ZS24_9BILA|nr:hypothetical protein Mgra_00004514 [Meloidogyne graminicola]